jgi:hypothetical protein
MKKELILFICLITLFIGGCAGFTAISGNNSQKKLENAQSEIDAVHNQLDKNNAEKAYAASTFATGTARALEKVTNAPVEIKIAKDMNDRVLSILGNPYLDDQNKIKQIVDELSSQVEKVRKQGEKQLAEKDEEVADLQVQRDDLKVKIKQKVDEFNALANNIAEKNDANQAIVDKCNSFFGLGAVFYGLKRFITSCLLFLLIGAIVFLAIKMLSNIYPPVAAAMGVFNMGMSLVLHTIKTITPEAFHISGFTSTNDSNQYKDVLYKTVDTIETMKSHEKLLAQNGKAYSFDDFSAELDKDYGDNDKRLYDNIKHDLRW